MGFEILTDPLTIFIKRLSEPEINKIYRLLFSLSSEGISHRDYVPGDKENHQLNTADWQLASDAVFAQGPLRLWSSWTVRIFGFSYGFFTFSSVIKNLLDRLG